MSRRAVFLDRDGTLNVRAPEHQYVTSVNDFAWIPGAVRGVAALARAGYVLTVISNQRGVGRGLVSPTTLHEIEQRMQQDLAAEGCGIERFRYCFHTDEDDCGCRKPRPGMILGLAAELDLDLGGSWVIGDTPEDVAAGKAAGCLTALVGRARADADLLAPSLSAASEAIASGRQLAARESSGPNSSMSA
jgi:histidinol-phosphate phosphatase family protein